MKTYQEMLANYSKVNKDFIIYLLNIEKKFIGACRKKDNAGTMYYEISFYEDQAKNFQLYVYDKTTFLVNGGMGIYKVQIDMELSNELKLIIEEHCDISSLNDYIFQLERAMDIAGYTRINKLNNILF